MSDVRRSRSVILAIYALARDGTRAQFDLGEFFVIDADIGGGVENKIDLEDYGRELGALADYETLVWEE